MPTLASPSYRQRVTRVLVAHYRCCVVRHAHRLVSMASVHPDVRLRGRRAMIGVMAGSAALAALCLASAYILALLAWQRAA